MHLYQREEYIVDKEKKKQIIKSCIAMVVFALIIILVVAVMVKYQVEGDKNMPFNLYKIIIVIIRNFIIFATKSAYFFYRWYV